MKPKDLKTAFSWESRTPMIQEGILHVPAHFDRHDGFDFPTWKELFGTNHPVIVEFCSGHGHWIVEKAKVHPDRNWVAVEMKFERVRRIWSKRKNENLDNLFIVSGEAWTFSHYYIPESTIETVYINFPDPWPKNRHEKHRLLRPQFMSELSRILKKGGRVHFVTDDRDYLERTLNLFLHAKSFKHVHPSPYFVTEHPNFGTSYFDTLWRSKGKQIHYTEFCKQW
ncbi:MAG: tRNA (guanine-N(7)-)-methyltransferase [Chlamydiales bacterium]|nr:tRNA (guanine-N(7)-)-methyltransferase [Chlamydiales bacterium]MCH9620566.1 tRNA (guanine-N(7)-)-methyltransferase [Chlamydiales bacterium]MCH9623562.1 tRNA (guanine-N(7)-)-methyltransferase [Chlamydiales bacterium]